MPSVVKSCTVLFLIASLCGDCPTAPAPLNDNYIQQATNSIIETFLLNANDTLLDTNATPSILSAETSSYSASVTLHFPSKPECLFSSNALFGQNSLFYATNTIQCFNNEGATSNRAIKMAFGSFLGSYSLPELTENERLALTGINTTLANNDQSKPNTPPPL